MDCAVYDVVYVIKSLLISEHMHYILITVSLEVYVVYGNGTMALWQQCSW